MNDSGAGLGSDLGPGFEPVVEAVNPEPPSLRELAAELGARIEDLEQMPFPDVKERVFAVLQLMDFVHRVSVKRLSEQLEARGVFKDILEDQDIALLFTLYDLNPFDPSTRVERALELVRPYMRSHGGEVEVLEIEETGLVHVRLQGACQSCVASGATLKNGIEAALREGLEGFTGLVVHEPEAVNASLESAGLIGLPIYGQTAPQPETQAISISGLTMRAPVFTQVATLETFPAGSVKIVRNAERAVLLARIGNDVTAFEATCTCGFSLEGAKLSGTVLVCGWKNCAFDVRSGRRVDGEPGSGLRVYPISVQDGRVLLAASLAPTTLFAGGN